MDGGRLLGRLCLLLYTTSKQYRRRIIFFCWFTCTWRYSRRDLRRYNFNQIVNACVDFYYFYFLKFGEHLAQGFTSTIELRPSKPSRITNVLHIFNILLLYWKNFWRRRAYSGTRTRLVESWPIISIILAYIFKINRCLCTQLEAVLQICLINCCIMRANRWL